MICQSCGHDFPSTLTRCTVCGRLTARRTRSFSDSRLIEFPRQARITPDKNQANVGVPAWRLEITERVRQAKARRGTASVNGDQTPVDLPEPSQLSSGLDAGRSVADKGPIVEAALTRVRRANQEGAIPVIPALTAPSIKPGSTGTPGSTLIPTSAKTTLVIDRQATARALEPAEEARSLEFDSPAQETLTCETTLISVQTSVSAAKVVPKRTVGPVAPLPEMAPRLDTDIAHRPDQTVAFIDPLDGDLIEEIEPVDYLEAEVRKVDQSLARELMTDESATVFSHLITLVTDLLTIAVSSVPFVALTMMINGSLSDRTTIAGLGALTGLLGLFYLSLTQSLCGKTFGMMFTNTRVIETACGKRPSVARALLRSLTYPIALAPAGIGILWSAIDPKRRAWQDIISGTRVVRDF